MRQKLFAVMLFLGLVSVPAALAATREDSAPSAKLAELAPFQRDELREFERVQRLEARRQERREARKLKRLYASVQKPAVLESIASCESGGNPRAVSSTGMYRGKYQFSRETWQAVGGQGDPAAATEAEQDYRAALLYHQSGPGQWPVCGA